MCFSLFVYFLRDIRPTKSKEKKGIRKMKQCFTFVMFFMLHELKHMPLFFFFFFPVVLCLNKSNISDKEENEERHKTLVALFRPLLVGAIDMLKGARAVLEMFTLW